MSFLATFVTVVFVFVALFMVLVILLQAGKGGGLGSALGGGASQSVFGGGGGADFMAKLTQAFAATFMISAMYLAYDSAHTGSDLLKSASKDTGEQLVDDDQVVNYEQVGPNPLRLPPASARGGEAADPAAEGAPADDAEAARPADATAPPAGDPDPAADDDTAADSRAG